MNPLLEIVVNEPFQADRIQDLYSNKEDLNLANPRARYPFSASEWSEILANNSENISLLFKFNEKTVAHTALILNDERLYICFVIVEKEFRNQGIGKELIRLAEEFVRLNYAHQYLYLNVHPENILAINLYKRMDYKTVDKQNDLITMSKDMRILKL